MKKILITGKNSYVGNNLAEWLGQNPQKYEVEKISLRGNEWKMHDFSVYDVVFHVAGIAHVSRDPKLEDKYYRVNRDLTIKVAKKAKDAGVRQFIFMSSIIVYGKVEESKGLIDKNTKPRPENFYGKSKLEAEKGLLELQEKSFSVVIVRPPMIYGKGAKGNYKKLSIIAKKFFVFPEISNRRSIIYISNLCYLIEKLISNNEEGIFYPQNKKYIQTTELVRTIAKIRGNDIYITSKLNWIIKLFFRRTKIYQKAFGNLVYSKELSQYKECYEVVDFIESIKITEGKG